MEKINLESILETLLSEGQDAATPMMHKYIIETCLEINNSIIREDDENIDPDANSEFETTDSTDVSTPAILTVSYKDPEGDCSYDAAILSALGREDMDGAGYADGIRSLVFQYETMDAAESASDILADRDENSDLPEELSSDVVELDFEEPAVETETETETTTDVDESEELPGEESPLTNVDNINEEETSTEEDTGEVDDHSDIFTDPNETTEEKVEDLASEIEELKRQIEALTSEDDTSLEEGFDFENVKAPKTVDGTDSSGKKIKQNDESLIPGNDKTVDQRLEGAAPIEIKGKGHVGYARETAPAVKTISINARNQKTKATDDMEKVSKEGDKSAELNKSFPAENDKSIIDGSK